MPAPDAPLIVVGLSRDASLSAGRAFLRSAGVDAADEDARALLLVACGIDRLALVTAAAAPVSESEAQQYRSLLDRRAAGEPTSRILGRRAFWTLDLEVRPGVLDPRPDSEALVRLALRVGRRHRRAPRRILDLGCGSGALLCAVLDEFADAHGVGVDLSDEACAATRANLAACDFGRRAAVFRGRWSAALVGPFDLIVSNPPYIRAGDIAGLDREVRDHDPRLALDGGPDGLDAYRELFAGAPDILGRDGVIAVEFGSSQAGDVERLANGRGLQKIDAEQDISGRPRASAFAIT